MRLLDIATAVLVIAFAGATFQASAFVAGEQASARTRLSAKASEAGPPRDASAARPRPVPDREVDVVAERFAFDPDRIEVLQGDHVRVTVRSADGTHGFEIRGMGIRATVPRDGEPITVEFDADRAGTFEIKCFEYCGTGHKQMKATLVVDPADTGK